MTHLITFGDLSWFMLLPSILSIGLGLNYVILEQLFKLKIRHQLFIYAANNSLSKISMIILNLISKKRERKTTMNLFTRLTQAYLRPSNQSDFHAIKQSLSKTSVILFILLCSILHYIYFILHFIFRFIENFTLSAEGKPEKVASKYFGILIIFFQILVLTPLNRVVFKSPIYRHQQLALVMALLGTGLYLFRMFEDPKDTSIYYILSGTILNCFEIVIEKYLMENKYITIFEILFYEGCVEFCINALFFGISYSFFRQTEGCISLFGVEVQRLSELADVFNDNKLWLCIIELLGHFAIEAIIELSLILTLFYLNPNFSYVSEIVSIFFIWILENFKLGVAEFMNVYWPSSILGYLTILLGALIYNEIIILYICGLERNTKKEIRKRAGNYDEMEFSDLPKGELVSDPSIISDL